MQRWLAAARLTVAFGTGVNGSQANPENARAMKKRRRMKGTRHFPRLAYNAARGLREIVAPVQTMPGAVWDGILQEFEGRCVYCGQGPTKENRGIVPDHVVPATQFGELVIGNVVPACQTCNDSRGNDEWRQYLRARFPNQAEERIEKIESHLLQHNYEAVNPERVLSPAEFKEYNAILADWERVLATASQLYSKVKARRNIK